MPPPLCRLRLELLPARFSVLLPPTGQYSLLSVLVLRKGAVHLLGTAAGLSIVTALFLRIVFWPTRRSTGGESGSGSDSRSSGNNCFEPERTREMYEAFRANLTQDHSLENGGD